MRKRKNKPGQGRPAFAPGVAKKTIAVRIDPQIIEDLNDLELNKAVIVEKALLNYLDKYYPEET